MQKEGPRTFARYPVGAGPFTVVSDSYNSELVVRKNPRYWEAGHPYLDQITFKSAGSDEAAIEALLAGQGQVYENMSTTTLIDQAQQHLQVENNLGTSPYDLQLNTAVPPFNNPRARQAIYAATGFAPILKAVFGTRYPLTEGFTGPGGICHESAVPGYQGYDPALARKLAAESGLGKVTFTLGTINSSAAAVETTKALRAEWAQVGIHAAIRPYNLLSLVPAFAEDHGRPWQAMVQTAGAFDPASGAGAGLRFDSASPFSGVHDPHLDWLLSRARSYTSLATRCKYYREAAAYIAENYYGPFCFSLNPANVSAKGTGGPGLTSTLPAVVVAPAIPWEDVRYSPPE
ncbi:MAG TPA: ABC transporter substrate-binding protein [Trebonia sp.]|nr:ABC transporter substrate-binding protein [Trebonia sp.]